MNNRRSKRAATMSRREFLKGSAAVAGAAIAWPAIVPSSVFGAGAPSNRITMGCIGLGGQGTGNMKGFRGKSSCEVVAVCDADAGHLEKARQIAGLAPAFSYTDFREVLARDDIDAVSVAAPDHWHVPISIAAVRSGKDVFCEKPLTLTIGEGRVLADEVKRYGRVFQTGSQQRSGSEFRFACELVRNGRIGKLHTMRVGIHGNNRKCPPTWEAEPVPDGFDYDMWLGPAPWEPYTTQRCHYQFRFILDYSGGQMTNWGAHYLDIAQWGNAVDDTGPVEIVGSGDFPKTGLFTTAQNENIEYTYANGVKLFLKSSSGHTHFEGTEGWVDVTRGKIDTEPKSLLTSKIGPDEIHLYESNDHKQNFLDCIKSRKDTICTAEIGHRTASVCHLGNIAMILGRKLKWDPKDERFVNDPEADKMRARALRAPWRL
ncbi:MAG: Gfo/Idh/MocA family oxidoreductase [Planctomycetes bacterium]|nr:Gfo/Idh/MocA family oxidoreductase [Planctomycetota bacterium]